MTPHPTAAWVLACRNEDGGFGSFPGDVSALRPTACAVELLDLLQIPLPRADEAAAFVRAQQNPDGAFRGRPWGLRWQQRSTLINSHYGLRALRALRQPLPRPGPLRDFVLSRRRADGAFVENIYPERAALCRETFFAVSLLRALDADLPEPEKTVSFLHRMQRENLRRDGGFMAEDTPDWRELVAAARARADGLRPYRDAGPEDDRAIPVTVGYTYATYFAAAALALLDSRPPDPEAAIFFLCSQQHPGGGFLSGLGDYGAYRDLSQGRLSDTCQALSGLRLLAAGDPADPAAWPALLRSGRFDPDRCAAWIASCQNPDGGFARQPHDLSRPSDMEATLQAVTALHLLGRPLPDPSPPRPRKRERLPARVGFDLSSQFFQPDQPGQALYLHRIVSPLRRALRHDEPVAIALMNWASRHLIFTENYRSEAALLIEDGTATCGGQARCLAGLLEAANIPARFLMVEGHCVTEAHLGGRWCLLDPEFDGAFRRPDGLLYSAFEISRRHLRGEPPVTTFGDWRYRSYTIHWPQPGGNTQEIPIGPDDRPDSPSVRAAYPELNS